MSNEDTVREIGDVASRMRNLEPVLRVLAVDLAHLLDIQFDAEREPGGRPWKPLKHHPVGRRKILQKTGALRRSIEVTATRDRILIESDVFYAPFQNWGTRTIPARKFFPTDDDRGAMQAWQERARAAIERYVLTGQV